MLYKRPETRSPTIASGASLSGEIVLNDYALTGIRTPATWTAANLTFQGSEAIGGTFADIFDSDGTELTVTAAASRAIALSTAEVQLVSSFKVIKIRSGTTGVPVNQAADRALVCQLK